MDRRRFFLSSFLPFGPPNHPSPWSTSAIAQPLLSGKILECTAAGVYNWPILPPRVSLFTWVLKQARTGDGEK